MHSPFSPRNDPAIPVLTEVLDLPLEPSASSTPGDAAAEAAGSTGLPPPPARGPDLEAHIESLRAAILQDLTDRVEPLLKTRMRAALEIAAARAVDDIAGSLREELGHMVEEAVQKELIRREAAELLSRSRPKAD